MVGKEQKKKKNRGTNKYVLKMKLRSQLLVFSGIIPARSVQARSSNLNV